jgi:large subunit ribosomal protein L6
VEKLFVEFGKKMSRVGRKPINIPEGVTIEVNNGAVVVAGPKGSLTVAFRPEIEVLVENKQVLVKRKKENKLAKSLHGLTRTLIANAVEGVTNGFSKSLEVVGTGYRASLEGETLVLAVGFSHLVRVPPPAGIKFEVEGNNKIKVSGIDKVLVGQVAAQIRKIRPPDPYKGKGIRYDGEEIKLKPGKAGKAGAAGAAGGGK